MNGPPTIASIVEGHGEVKALPVLVRRIASELLGVHYVVTPPPFRVARHKMTIKDGLSGAAYVQAARVAYGGILVVADADDDCAVLLADQLREAAAATAVEVAIAVREFEAWYLAAIESLRSHRSVRDDAEYARDPEAPRGAKEALGDLMVEPYREMLHQPAFADRLDLQQAQRARSFTHLVGCVERLVGSSSSGGGTGSPA